MGAGKSTVLNRIREKGYLCVEEPAREILKEQRRINGDGVPEKNAKEFNNLMLQRMIHQFDINSDKNEIIIFDRGIPDIIGYSGLLNSGKEIASIASKEFRYNKHVFVFKGWEEIYATDDERKMSFDLAKNFGEDIVKIYQSLGYETLEVPFISADARVSFIAHAIERIMNEKLI